MNGTAGLWIRELFRISGAQRKNGSKLRKWESSLLALASFCYRATKPAIWKAPPPPSLLSFCLRWFHSGKLLSPTSQSVCTWTIVNSINRANLAAVPSWFTIFRWGFLGILLFLLSPSPIISSISFLWPHIHLGMLECEKKRQKRDKINWFYLLARPPLCILKQQPHPSKLWRLSLYLNFFYA